MSLRIVTFLGVLLLSHGLWAQVLCSKAFTPPYHKGTVAQRTSEEVRQYLGQGDEGGTVHRVIDLKTGRSYLEKTFYSDKGTGLKHDVAALKVLKELSPNDPLIKILEPIKQEGDNTLHFPDVKGFALDKLPWRKKREELTKEFQYWAFKMMDKADENPHFSKNLLLIDSIWLSYEVPPSRRAEFGGLEKVDIMLKPDNVIVDSYTGSLVIFDPF